MTPLCIIISNLIIFADAETDFIVLRLISSLILFIVGFRLITQSLDILYKLEKRSYININE